MKTYDVVKTHEIVTTYNYMIDVRCSMIETYVNCYIVNNNFDRLNEHHVYAFDVQLRNVDTIDNHDNESKYAKFAISIPRRLNMIPARLFDETQYECETMIETTQTHLRNKHETYVIDITYKIVYMFC